MSVDPGRLRGSQPPGARVNLDRIYLDHNATTTLRPEARQAMLAALDAANPSSGHADGRRARDLVERARAQVARRFGARPSQVTFVSGATEACALVIGGRGGDQVVSAIEHPAVLVPARALGATIVGVDSAGRLDPDRVAAAVTSSTRLVACMAVNNELGIRLDTRAVADRLGATPLLVDAVQAAPRGPVTLATTGATYLVISAHKLGGPKGVGALIHRDDAPPLTPLMAGGGQERGRRGGTENVPAIVGFAAACAVEPDRSHLIALHEALHTGLVGIPGAVIHGDPANTEPGTINLRFEGVSADDALAELDANGVSASSGSACATGTRDPSHVLLAVGLTAVQAAGALRFSVGWNNTQAEIARAVQILRDVVNALRV
ncbi:MAG: cysteine desulfurase [Myxococcota bacterium]|jgi:cysteine desulfurase